jgi:hypothetical protein
MTARTEAAGRARLSLTLAGRALDPNDPHGPCARLGQLLLGEAYVASVRVICDRPDLDSVDGAATALAAQRRPRRGGRAPNVASVLSSSVPSPSALLGAQLAVAQLVDEATGERRIGRARRVFWVMLGACLALAVAAALEALHLRRSWERYTWFASSAWESFPHSGTLADHDWSYDLVVHTDEQRDPWVVVDLLATRTIRQVVVVNRADCCSDRGVPLAIEVALDDKVFIPVATRSDPFDVWRADFGARNVRYVRLRSTGTTVINLRDIQIR